ncbi:MAG: hypothetical protein ACKOAZ_11675 [Ilumatobacteraceae bacterium]
MRLADRIDLRDPAVLRRIWGTGIGVVMTVSVSPYPIGAFILAGEEPHRIHNVVGALQYLPLWALPVLLLTWGRDEDAAWRLALMSSLAMAAVGLLSGDLLPSLSWLPLLTLIPMRRMGAWRGVRRPHALSLAAVPLAAYVAVRHAPTLIDYQRLGLADSHSVRFHFSGMAAAYIAVTGALALAALYPSGRVVRWAIVASALVAGVMSLAWPFNESALPRSSAAAITAAAACAGIAAVLDSRRVARRASVSRCAREAL